MPLVYRELHQAAHHYMAGERSGHTLQTSALVNEVYLRLVDLREVSWHNRSHFLAVCAKLMRQILTDYARSRLRLKRGGGVPNFSFDSNLIVFGEPGVDLLALDDALTRAKGEAVKDWTRRGRLPFDYQRRMGCEGAD